MPLRDHFRPPLDKKTSWEGFHGAWPAVIVMALNRKLPPRYNEAGLKPLDALHLSCAVEAGADYLCTCDDRFLKRARAVHSGPPKVVNPLELIREIGA
jgi:predicted nucleic acid-binding protein